MQANEPAAEKRTDRKTDAERRREIYQQIRPRGLHRNKGKPCLCGAEYIRTRSEQAYSDSLVFYHRCTECGNQFSTWIEG